ncbi:MAG: class I SAM-dependent methyltransferase [Proteobacteria bacterium]|nr:class I SAM-dependent methyltransferase [Pseudomonadota bacterium]MDA1062970.1 class I SAM-dependent methyltransferase [Pseudomonadota bacterium]
MQSVFREFLAGLRNTPLHPQWFAFFREQRSLREVCKDLTGLVLDIGCADAKPKRHLSAAARYVGVDYYSTARSWYGTRPDVYADAQALPLADASVDHSLLLDVLEHIPQPDLCLAELGRVLKPGGSLTIQVPFLYPVHDAPLDFHRWTRHGLLQAAQKYGFRVSRETAIGHPLETAALNANIAFSKTVINWIQQRNPLAVLAIFLPLFVLLANCLAWTLAALGRDDDLMPYAYKMVWIKA